MPESETVSAIRDLTRVVIAMSGKCPTKADAVRKLHELGIRPSNIAAIMSSELKDVTSQIAKDKKRKSMEK